MGESIIKGETAGVISTAPPLNITTYKEVTMPSEILPRTLWRGLTIQDRFWANVESEIA